MFYQIGDSIFIRLDEIAEINFTKKAVKIRFTGDSIIRNYEVDLNDEGLDDYINRFKNSCSNYRNFLAILYKTGKIK